MNTHTIVWRNKPEIDTLSMDDLYNNLKIYEPEVKGTSSSSTNTQNVAFVSSNSTSSTNGAVNTAHGLESVEARLLVYTKNESVYEKDTKDLKREIHLREVAITELRRKLELAQKQKG
ncbi:hypothetical protein Tco_0917189 [Tanacetum coccineum]